MLALTMFQSAPGLIRQAKPAGGSKPADWLRPERRGYQEDNHARRRCLRHSFPLKREVSNQGILMNCEVTADHVVTIKIPEHIPPGTCKITVLVNGYKPTVTPYAQEETSVDPNEFVTRRLAALEAARARFGNLVLSSEVFATAKQEEIDLEEHHFVR